MLLTVFVSTTMPVFSRERFKYYGYCLPRFRNLIAVIRDAVYMELRLRPH